MDNKKLLKFLQKDIAEIEELFAEKGSEGFDEFEKEFIRSRFKEANRLILLLSEQEDSSEQKISQPVVVEEPKKVVAEVQEDKTEEVEEVAPVEITSVKDVKEKLVEVKKEEVVAEQEEEKIQDEEIQPEDETVEEEPINEEVEIIKEEPTPEAISEEISEPQKEEVKPLEEGTDVELEEEEEPEVTSKRLGDSFSKEKSVNELLAGDSNNLEYKISNSPVKSIQSAIGINDRYQYIRELFEGNADSFSKAVTDLDNLNNIQEAVSYLQKNYKWKKTETSLKFVNLIKRRFPNG